MGAAGRHEQRKSQRNAAWLRVHHRNDAGEENSLLATRRRTRDCVIGPLCGILLSLIANGENIPEDSPTYGKDTPANGVSSMPCDLGGNLDCVSSAALLAVRYEANSGYRNHHACCVRGCPGDPDPRHGACGHGLASSSQGATRLADIWVCDCRAPWPGFSLPRHQVAVMSNDSV